MIDERFIDLAGRFLDGEASEEERAALASRLEKDPDARRTMAGLINQHATLRWLHSSRAAAPVRSVHRPVRPATPIWRLWAGIAACALAIAGAMVFYRPPQPREKIAVLEISQGAVSIVDGSTFAARQGQPLFAGQGIFTSGAGSSAGIQFADGTWVELGPDTSIGRMTSAAGKRLALSKGSMLADVTPQPKDLPMTIASPHAEVRVVGTLLMLNAAPGHTRVHVEKGSVEVRRERESIVLPAGHYAAVAKGVNLAATPVPSESLNNGGFETGDFTGWGDRENNFKPESVDVGRYAHSGTSGLRLVGRHGGVDQQLLTVPGRIYYASARVRLEKEISKLTWGGLRLAAYPEAKGLNRWKPLAQAPFVSYVSQYGSTKDYLPAGTGAWTRVRFSFVAASAVTTFRCDLFSDGTFEAWVDDMEVSPSPIPD